MGPNFCSHLLTGSCFSKLQSAGGPRAKWLRHLLELARLRGARGLCLPPTHPLLSCAICLEVKQNIFPLCKGPSFLNFSPPFLLKKENHLLGYKRLLPSELLQGFQDFQCPALAAGRGLLPGWVCPGQVPSPPHLRLERTLEATEAELPWTLCGGAVHLSCSDLRVPRSPQTSLPSTGQWDLWGRLEQVRPVGSGTAPAHRTRSPCTANPAPVTPRSPGPHTCRCSPLQDSSPSAPQISQIVTPLSQQPPSDPVQKPRMPQLPVPNGPPNEASFGLTPLPCPPSSRPFSGPHFPSGLFSGLRSFLLWASKSLSVNRG